MFHTDPRLAPENAVPASAGAVFPFLAGVLSGDAVTDKKTALDYALEYIHLGWFVLPLKPGTKQPANWLVPNGVHGATNDAEVVKRWWGANPDCGIGIAMLQSGLVAVDIDPRNGGFDTMERLEAQHGPLVSDVLAYTGGGGEHRVFFASLVANLPGKLGPGVDLKADGYIVVEPSIHPSGKAYAWEASSDPLEGAVPSTLPGWIRDLSRGPFGAAVSIPATRMVDPKQVEELRDALDCIPADDYHQWVNFGNALVELGHEGFKLWDTWSQKSTKYDAQAVTRKWRSFKGGAFQLESIFFEAQNFGWANPAGVTLAPIKEPVAVPIESVRVRTEVKADVPDALLRPAGILGVVTDWVNATSRKPQPVFAVQAAIAFASTVLGRRFVTTQRNWPSVYLLNIGKSASGKEHAKWAVEHLLEACELSSLIGPASYTSSSGLLSALHAQPSHLTVIDEFGKEMEQAAIKHNARAQGMVKSLIEVWGRCDGTLRPQGYSSFGMSDSDAAKMKERSVRNPSLSLLAMTTPETFFDTIGSAAARDGFLNRFLIVESDIGRRPSQMVNRPEAPSEVLAWVRAMHALSDGVVNPSSQATLVPTPVVVDMSREALELFRHFDAECVELMDQYEEHGLAEMFGRTNEMAMRLALLVALGCSHEAPFAVDGPSAAWAIQYCRHHAVRTVERLVTSVADNQFESSKKQVLALLAASGARGMTEYELNRRSSKFRGMKLREQLELLKSLEFVGQAKKVTFATGTTGRPRSAWVALDEPPEDEAIQGDDE